MRVEGMRHPKQANSCLLGKNASRSTGMSVQLCQLAATQARWLYMQARFASRCALEGLCHSLDVSEAAGLIHRKLKGGVVKTIGQGVGGKTAARDGRGLGSIGIFDFL
jgi:hypothetical protein